MNSVIDSRFSGRLEIEKIRQLVTVRPTPTGDLSSLDPVLASIALSEALKRIYLPNQFSLSFIQEMVGRADIFSRCLFASERDYVAKLYDSSEVSVAPICLTGLAGVGKSKAIEALRKVLPGPLEFYCDHFQDSVTLISHWYASARGKASLKQLLAGFALGSEPADRSMSTGELLTSCRRIGSRHGVSLLILDEAQHVTEGSGVALVTGMLLYMARIGIPMVYATNYSLLHKLDGRPSEDKQRLMVEPRDMLPDDPTGQDWKDYIAECVRVSGGQIRAPQYELCVEIYHLTFGIKRLVVQLLALAYIECRKAGQRHIGLVDIKQAYLSLGYSANRKDLAELVRIAVEGPRGTKRKDLYSPLGAVAMQKSNVLRFSLQDRDERSAIKMIDSSMTPREREAVKQIEAASRSPQAKATRRKPAPTPTTAESQAAFAQYVGRTDSDRPRKPR
ncbi:ATP-binding protein [Pseudomonas putida]|uniref:ORC1/DEAH AAA+ ATPase domain-containing protein n=1 Tax=Pseudomonas putida TaxID=303 RepID=A0A1Q9QZE8_PSEPU|nr:ATP-binding protein [Pseudomonas putida]OLS60516.1 hypothetical protein PSEMO_46130 [Pseudomonas putida]